MCVHHSLVAAYVDCDCSYRVLWLQNNEALLLMHVFKDERKIF